jgi:hypothetical protein
MKTKSKTIYKGELLHLYDVSPDSEDLFDGVILEYVIRDGKEHHQLFIDRVTFNNIIQELPAAIANYKQYRIKYPKRKS